MTEIEAIWKGIRYELNERYPKCDCGIIEVFKNYFTYELTIYYLMNFKSGEEYAVKVFHSVNYSFDQKRNLIVEWNTIESIKPY